VAKDPFPKVNEAREAARARALEILEDFVSTIKLATAAGDYEAAMKSYQWLLEHMPEDEGTRVIDSSVDNKKQIEGPVGPQINIGFRISGVPDTEPAQIVTVEPKQIEAQVVKAPKKKVAKRTKKKAVKKTKGKPKQAVSGGKRGQ